MDYEKLYKDALAKAREIHRNEVEKRFDMEWLFPELKESEDEKIRNRILLSLEKDLMATKNSGCDTQDLEQCIAWLEKQGEQKPVIDFKAKNWYVSKVDGKIHDMTYNPANKVESKVGEKIEDEIEIPFGAKDSELQEETYYIPKGFHAEIDDDKVVIKKGEKSAAWSNKDERMCQETIDWFEKKCFPYALEEENPARESIKWLKSLKDRIGG